MQQTKQMKSCCPFPKNEEMTGECKEHLEGIESKEEKDKWHAMSCFSDCYYKSKGMINEAGELQVNQMKTETNNILDANDGADFKDISMKSIDYCNTASK